MKIGDYVRFDYHKVSTPIQIAKITETHYDSEDDSICYSTDIGLVIDESNLIKEPSSNIMDLIEVGDYVNRHKVIYTAGEKHKLVYVEYVNMSELLEVKSYQIKSIVTKEQFESMEYRVGD